MIDSVKVRRQCMLDFYSHYEHLCAVQGSVPLKAVKANLNEGALDITVDRIKAADWAPLLNAIRHNKTLTSIAIRSFHQQGLGESGVERYKTYFRRRIPAIRSKDLTGQLCKAVKGCLSISDVLKSLELQGLLLRERDLILLTKGLAKTSSLESISLAHCLIGDGGLETICQSVKNSASIRCINFTGCSLTWRGAEHMANVLKVGNKLRCVALERELRLLYGPIVSHCIYRRSCLSNCMLEAICGGHHLLTVHNSPSIQFCLRSGCFSFLIRKYSCFPFEVSFQVCKKGCSLLTDAVKRLTSKKSVSPGKKNPSVKDSYSPKPLPPGTKGFLPWRTAERAKRCRGAPVDSTQELPVKIQVLSLSCTFEKMMVYLVDGCLKRMQILHTCARIRIYAVNGTVGILLICDICALSSKIGSQDSSLHLEIENARLRNLNISLSEVLHAQSVTNMILEDEGVLGSIENSFQKFHAFLDLLKDAGLGQLAALAGIDQSDFGPLGHPQMNSTLTKPAKMLKEKSFEEERQEHTQNRK
ncbi:CEP78 protein, partial [Dromaius novaehollandiae]|nr:CEP78 protein [Dromaius novaehollandiae]